MGYRRSFLRRKQFFDDDKNSKGILLVEGEKRTYLI